MSYQVLARKYRPKSFETLVGQEHVVRALTHALEQQRLHHAYLFTGTRGVGKTTLSRILAKSFNCETGITAHACGKCDACLAIDAGRFVDYIEMDAASNRGVDEMAQLLEQAVYAPSNARFKVYMIDEVHMLTNHAFNSMLKTLEEPPEHVKFILATTDPQKIPVTVLSRCLQFNLKQMPPGHIVGHLEDILGQEEISFEAPALRLLAQGAHGSMRDALSLTDQAIAYAAGKVTLEAVQGMLGALDQSYLIRALDALAVKDGAGLLAVADEMAARSLSYPAALQDLGVLLHRIALAQTVPSAVPEDLPERADILRLAGLFDAEEIQLFYQIAVHGRNELGLAPDEYAGFSMTLLRMLAFRPGIGGAEARANPAPQAAPAPAARLSAAPQVAVTSTPAIRPAVNNAPSMPSAASSVVSSTNAPAATTNAAASAAPNAAPSARPAGTMSPARAALEAARGGKKIPSAPAAPSAPSISNTAVAASAPAVQSAPPLRVDPSDAGSPPPWLEDMPDMPPIDFPSAMEARDAVHTSVDLSTAPSVASYSQPPAALTSTIEIKPPRPFVPVPVPVLDWDGNWPQLAAALPVRGVAQQLAQQSELVTCDVSSDVPLFTLRIAVDTLRAAGSVDKLAAALTEKFGRTVRVDTEIGVAEQTANAAALAEREALQKQTEQLIQSDPFVQNLMREFGATIVPGSIKPV